MMPRYIPVTELLKEWIWKMQTGLPLMILVRRQEWMKTRYWRTKQYCLVVPEKRTKRKTELERLKIENKEFQVPPSDRRSRKFNPWSSTPMENKNADIYLNTIMAFNSTYQEESLEDNNSNFISLNSSTDSLVKFSQSLFRMLASAALLGNVTALIADCWRDWCGSQPGYWHWVVWRWG